MVGNEERLPAIAPTATISNIIGVSACIEPTYQNLFVKSNLSGEFTVVNDYLVRDLKARGLWDEVMIADLKYFDGSLSKIDRIPQDLDEISLHQAIVAFYSDFTLMTTALRPHGLSWISPNLQCASIDHTIYFHRPLRADDWMLYDMEATISASSRGLNFGRMWQNGQLVCSTVQEGLIRLREIETQ